jgi:hypothetical protein
MLFTRVNTGGYPYNWEVEGEVAFVGADPCVCPENCKKSTLSGKNG